MLDALDPRIQVVARAEGERLRYPDLLGNLIPDYAKLPVRPDFTPDETERETFRPPRRPVEYREYRCAACANVAGWAPVLFDDGSCELCAETNELDW